MFFNKKAKIAKEISNAILNLIRANLIGLSHLPSEKFTPPYGFWLDPYVFGFINGLFDAFMKFDFGGDNMSLKKRTEIRYLCLGQICENDAMAAIRQGQELLKVQDTDLHRGMNDALTIYQVVSGRMIDNDENPTLVEARKIAPSFRDILEEAADERSSTAALLSAVYSLTLGKHISEKYG
jgi:hypothetical protein